MDEPKCHRCGALARGYFCEHCSIEAAHLMASPGILTLIRESLTRLLSRKAR